MKKRATVIDRMSTIVGPATEVRDLSDDPTALAEAQATLERHEAKNWASEGKPPRAATASRERPGLAVGPGPQPPPGAPGRPLRGHPASNPITGCCSGRKGPLSCG